ncbi:helix-turn-helix transcriptional regulator [Tateyamaria omphalii]|uniref:Transcriptional regulator n=1 Tax=Tateyamaria omphalii TaxID=299262 RepID=A0A1P8MRQ2_9RHOB|nr:helix-turn-helix transcriptional regulator [Tateyamaria omphalii]APX10692.1 transcriptional regulator [Tateyamaria omphalii]
MARDALTGTRIRERRAMGGLKQSDLARQIGISASYLNLIEHNRRRIGGKLLLDIAAVLDVEPTVLSEGAEAALIASLQEAAQRARLPEEESARAEEFAGRFPGWAEALAAAHRKIADLQRTVETLSDRLAHDPELAASVHEVLSTAASIRSTASILAEDKTITQEWRDRFHANIDADSRRLAHSSKALVGFLDAETGEAAPSGSPQEEVAAFLGAHAQALEAVEDGAEDRERIVSAAPELASAQSRHLARTILDRMVQDSAQVGLADLKAALSSLGPDVIALAAHFAVSVPHIMRRLAAVPDLDAGLVVADRAGSLLFRKDTEGFAIPRHGAACPLWPLFQVMGQPGQIMRARVQMPTRDAAVFDCYAAAEPVGPVLLNAPPLLEATMLILPAPEGPGVPDLPPEQVGPACHICPRSGCPGRREPSILSEGFSGF